MRQPISGDRLRSLLLGGVPLESIVRRLWLKGPRTVLLVSLPAIACMSIGLAMQKWYASGATFTVEAPQSLPAGAASFAGLATQLGLGTAGATSPQFYVELLQSRTLHDRLLGASFPLGPNESLTTLDDSWAHSKPITPRVHAASLAKLRRHFSASGDPRTGIISFTVEGPSPTVARLMADTAMAALNDIVVSIRRKRAGAEREFLEQRWADIRDTLTLKENALRRFYERNRQITSPELQFEDLRLRREVDRVQSVYTDVGLRLEQARIQEVRDIPAISPIDFPATPTRKSAPRLSSLVVLGALLGFVGAVLLSMFEMAGEFVNSR